jgi:lysophospholipase L1-like esterase
VSPRLRVAIANLAVAAGALVVVLVCLEGVLRFTGLAREREAAARRMVDARWTVLLDCYPSNPRGTFDIDLRRPENDARYRRLAPGRFDAIARHHPWAVETRYNALRFRDAEVAAKPPGVRRVLLFGDSFTEGQGVKEPETAARVLGRLLEEKAPGRFEVRNAGRRGLDFPELFEAFEAALVYEPDVVVYALVLNDAVQPPGFRARQSFVNDWILDRERLPDEPTDDGRPFRSRLFGLLSDRVTAWRVGRATTRWYLDMWGDANRAGRERTEDYLEQMQRRLEALGARLVVAPWPLFVGLERGYPFEPVHHTIRRFCLAAGILHHELLEAYAGRRTEELWVHPVDHHPNETAHRLAAGSLAPVVLKLAP